MVKKFGIEQIIPASGHNIPVTAYFILDKNYPINERRLNGLLRITTYVDIILLNAIQKTSFKLSEEK